MCSTTFSGSSTQRGSGHSYSEHFGEVRVGRQHHPHNTSKRCHTGCTDNVTNAPHSNTSRGSDAAPRSLAARHCIIARCSIAGRKARCSRASAGRAKNAARMHALPSVSREHCASSPRCPRFTSRPPCAGGVGCVILPTECHKHTAWQAYPHTHREWLAAAAAYSF